MSQVEQEIAFNLLNGFELNIFSPEEGFNSEANKTLGIIFENRQELFDKLELRECEKCGKIESLYNGGGSNDDGEVWCNECFNFEF